MFSVHVLYLILHVTVCFGRRGSNKCSKNKQYDYIIVGAGTGGSMVASELATQLPNKDILLIEEGSYSRVNPNIDDASLWPTLLSDATLERFYKTVPQPYLNNRIINLPRSKVTGGCNSHNAGVYVLANENDFDEQWGNIPGWTLNDVMDIWDEIELVNQGTQWDETNQFFKRLFESGVDNGYYYQPNANWNDLRNKTQPSGTNGFITSVVIQGEVLNTSYVKRRTAWTDFVEPLLPASNLDILILTRVNKILFDHKYKKNKNMNAIGVETENLGTFEVITYLAKEEIIISAGSYDTPKLLMLSGIGDCDYLENIHNIDCKVDLPGVGQNLQDHLQSGMLFGLKNGNINGNFDPFLSEIPEIVINGGLDAPTVGVAAIRDKGRYVHAIGGSTLGISLIAITQLLESVGNVTLLDDNPGSAPVIDHNYLGVESDLDTAVNAIKIARNLVYNTDAFDELFELYNITFEEIVPGSSIVTDEEIKEWIRNNLSTIWHPAGTCKMGYVVDSVDDDTYGVYDEYIVVNERLQVLNVNNLRIADASIMPKIVSANTNLMTMVIGKKAAKFIIEDA